MRQQGLRCQTRRRCRASTPSNHNLAVAANPLERQFGVAQPQRVYAGDITYVATHEGRLYWAGFLERFSGQGVGGAMSAWMSADLGVDALPRARWRRRPGNGLWVHADQGSQYASGRFQALVKEQRYLCSMSGTGNCWDNAPLESFFHTLKTALIHHRRFKPREQAKQDIFEYLEVFYNRQRKHSTLGARTPAECAQQHRKAV